MKKLRQITVIGLGLLGSSVTLAVSCGNWGIKTAGFSHQAATRRRARRFGVADMIFDDIRKSVADGEVIYDKGEFITE